MIKIICVYDKYYVSLQSQIYEKIANLPNNFTKKMKNFIEDFMQENNVTVLEQPRLKAKLLGTIFSRDQWYNRTRGITQLTRSDVSVMKQALAEVRQELQLLISTRPLDELEDANK